MKPAFLKIIIVLALLVWLASASAAITGMVSIEIVGRDPMDEEEKEVEETIFVTRKNGITERQERTPITGMATGENIVVERKQENSLLLAGLILVLAFLIYINIKLARKRKSASA